MAEETETIYVAVTYRSMFYSLPLTVTPAVKDRVTSRDVADPNISGTGTQLILLDWRSTAAPVELKVRVDTHVLTASTAKLTVNFIRELINSGRERDMYNITEGGSTWMDMEYIPVPSPTKTLRGRAVPEIEYLTPKVILTLRDL